MEGYLIKGWGIIKRTEFSCALGAVNWSLWDKHKVLLHAGVCPVDLFEKKF